jgi:hypothetical protein
VTQLRGSQAPGQCDWPGAVGPLDIEWYHRGPFMAHRETPQRLHVLARKPYHQALGTATLRKRERRR